MTKRNRIDLDDCKNHESLQEIWEALGGPELYVMEDGSPTAVNVADAQIRHLQGKYWLYVDETDGYSVLEEESVKRLALALAEDPRIRNRWDGNGNVIRDGVVIGKEGKP